MSSPASTHHPGRAPRLRLAVRGRSRRSSARTCSPGWRRAARSCPGVVGYEDSVVPAIENAILAGQDLVFLGERGQAKTRMARLLVGLLDEWLPVVRGGELNDDPMAPVSPAGPGDRRARAATRRRSTGSRATGATPRSSRRPDITIADLIGEVDPIKVAEGRYLSDELTLHYGLIPRANRGIVAINELPDLAERIQVGLLNILEERDVQIRGFVVRLPLDLYVVASANPEDYTSRGRIITPLKDRLGSQIRTHYPRTLEHEMAIVRQEKHRFAAEDGRAGGRRPAVHGGARRRADPPRPPLAGDQPAVRRQRPGLGRQRRGARGRRAQARGPARRAGRRRRGSRTWARSSPRRSARSSSSRSATRRPRSGSSSGSSPRRSTRRSAGTSRSTSSTASSTPSRTGSRSRPATGRRRASTSRWMREVPGLADAVRRLGAFDVTDGAEEPAVVASAVEFLLEGLHLAAAAQQGPDPGRDGLPPVTAYVDRIRRDLAASPEPRDLARRRADGPTDGAGRSPGRARYSRWDGTPADRRTSTRTRSSTRSPTTSWPKGDLAEALRRLMERGWRTGDPTRRRPGRPARPDGAPRAARARSSSSATSSTTSSATSGASSTRSSARSGPASERRRCDRAPVGAGAGRPATVR